MLTVLIFRMATYSIFACLLNFRMLACDFSSHGYEPGPLALGRTLPFLEWHFDRPLSFLD